MCSHCKQDAKFQCYSPKVLDSLLGEVRCSRPYYFCRHCKHGHFTWDGPLGLTARKLTPAAAEICALAGTLEDFDSGHTVLAKLSGLRVSESTVQRVTEDAGKRLADAMDRSQMFEPDEIWPWSRDANGKRTGYVSVDGVLVPMQGPGGKKAEHRLQYIGRLYNPPAEGPPRPLDQSLPAALARGQPPLALSSRIDPPPPPTPPAAARDPCREYTRYAGGFHTLDELLAHLQQHAARIGGDTVEQWICITDAGGGLAAAVLRAFCWVIWILDFWHAAEYLKELAQALYPDDEPARATWSATWCHALKHEGGAVVLDRLRALDATNYSAAAHRAWEDVVRYYGNHLDGMDYPRYLKNGWQIGSGPVEAACKTVVSTRQKRSGMRWREYGSNTVSHLRALFLNGLPAWDNFWQTCRN